MKIKSSRICILADYHLIKRIIIPYSKKRCNNDILLNQQNSNAFKCKTRITESRRRGVEYYQNLRTPGLHIMIYIVNNSIENAYQVHSQSAILFIKPRNFEFITPHLPLLLFFESLCRLILGRHWKDIHVNFLQFFFLESIKTNTGECSKFDQ